MKKTLSYAVTAILLGTVTMLVPLMLVKPGYIRPLASGDGEIVPRYCSQASETLDEEDSLGRAIYPSNLSFVGLMLVPSLLLALGISLSLKRRIFLHR